MLANSTVNSGLNHVFHVGGGALVLLMKYNTTKTMTKVFGTPVTKLIFALRMLVVSLAVNTLLPLLVSYIATTNMAFTVSNANAVFRFRLLSTFTIGGVPTCVLLKVFYNLMSLCFAHAVGSLRSVFHGRSGPCMGLLVNKIALDVLVCLFPSLCKRNCRLVRLLLGNGKPSS